MKMLRSKIDGSVHRWNEVVAKINYMEEFEVAKPAPKVEPTPEPESALTPPKKRTYRKKKTEE